MEFGTHQYGPGGFQYKKAMIDEDTYLEWIVAFPDVDPVVNIKDIDDRTKLIYSRSRQDIIKRLSDSDLGRKFLILKYPQDAK